MLPGAFGKTKSGSLMNEYASLVGEAVLRHRTRVAEHAARIEADIADKVRSDFIANMSHELRTPLNAVIGFSKLLSEHNRRHLPDAEIVQYAQLIQDAADHLLSAINDILDISKIQSGKFTLDECEVHLDEVLHVCLASCRQMAEEARVSIHNGIPFDLPPARGDSGKLRQVFSNILSNAIKFTPRGGSVWIEASRNGDGGASVFVRDSGIGMTPEEVRIALMPFGQIDGGRTRWREGRGLGLPIAKALVELHGGELVIKSVKGAGTEVGVILPPGHQASLAQGREAVSRQSFHA
jgi:two-component system cell cycle sensor histidine kinase PleC